MKKFQILIIALLTLVSNAMAGNKLVYKSSANCGCTLEATHDEQGNDGTADIKISLKSADSHQFFAFQMFVVLNEGLTLVPDEDEDYGDYIIQPSNRFGDTDKKKAKYGIQIAKKGDGYQIVCLHQQANAILESEGILLTIPVKNVPKGVNVIGQINDIEFTTLDGKAIRFEPEDISGTDNIMSASTSEGESKTYDLSGKETNGNRKGILIKNRRKIVNK